MLKSYHVEMMRRALGPAVSARALETMIRANLHQDRLLGLIGHDEYHFDNNAFEKSNAYIDEQRLLTVSSLRANHAPMGWAAFGRLTHAAQDFYAHTNYIDLWLARQTDEPVPTDVEPLRPDLIHSEALRSGKVYLLEALTFIPGLRPFVMRLIPRDSHAWMNLDSPERGPRFEYAFYAAVKRTVIEFERTVRDLPERAVEAFVDKGTGRLEKGT